MELLDGRGAMLPLPEEIVPEMPSFGFGKGMVFSGHSLTSPVQIKHGLHLSCIYYQLLIESHGKQRAELQAGLLKI